MIITMTALMSTACASFSGEGEQVAPEQNNDPPVSSESINEEEIEGDTVDLEDDPYLQEKETNDIRFEQEMEGAEINRTMVDPSKFTGKWEATSDQAIFFYGNVDLVVNSNGSWTADITEEKLGGTWKEAGDHIHLDDTSRLDFDFDLSFDKTGALIMTETADDGTEINTVLTKAN